MNITEAVDRACQEPTLVDALSWICVWESERATQQALNNINATVPGWDTCFKYCIMEVAKHYPDKILI